jgi:hypothetical protein
LQKVQVEVADNQRKAAPKALIVNMQIVLPLSKNTREGRLDGPARFAVPA